MLVETNKVADEPLCNFARPIGRKYRGDSNQCVVDFLFRASCRNDKCLRVYWSRARDDVRFHRKKDFREAGSPTAHARGYPKDMPVLQPQNTEDVDKYGG